MPAKTCPSCRSGNREIALFCAECGVRIEKMPDIGVPAAAGKATGEESWRASRQAMGMAAGGLALFGLAVSARSTRSESKDE